MATFKSSERIVSAGRDLIYSRLNNPESFKGIADNVPDDLKQQVGNIRIDGDVITLEANRWAMFHSESPMVLRTRRCIWKR